MSPKHVAPETGLTSFSCPQCGAHAHQHWFSVHAQGLDGKPPVYTDALINELEEDPALKNDQVLMKLLPQFRRLALGLPFVEEKKDAGYCWFLEMKNVFVSRRYSCGDITIWKHTSILYPPTRYEIGPGPDLPEDVRVDFEEARAVLDLSPRSAAALLRLCIQKLCKSLEVPGANLNATLGRSSRKVFTLTFSGRLMSLEWSATTLFIRANWTFEMIGRRRQSCSRSSTALRMT